jgi:Ankyrin repeats (3 copies)
MASLAEFTVPIELRPPGLSVEEFIPKLAANPDTPVVKLLEPYKAFEAELRKAYAQQPTHEALKDGKINLIPLFNGNEMHLKIRARSLASESDDEKSRYIMELKDEDRKPQGAPAVVSSFKDFQQNFNLFSESSLSDLDWNNVVAAGSSVTTALLPVPEKWAGSKRSMREYYHEHLAPASDVDLFIYGLNEEQALEKIKQIERNIKDSILHETTTIRTKNAITIASQYPTRHVQIVLRLYDSISQIITGFDVDCACAAYDGSQVYAAPRAVAAFVTQCNTIDLTRRSPSYENRLSKYSRRGFEVHWPLLDRTRIDPTIFERSFGRTQGLARLLILEKLPKTVDRDSYMDQRRAERGRPALRRNHYNRMGGNIKDREEDDVAEWVDHEEVASYHTMTVPYGPKYHAAKINRLLYTKDLLLNAEWNKPDDREVHLHRHPCFFGTAEEVLQDCCGYCPVPKTDDEIEVAEEESKVYISGALKFITDDPGRQEIGSFNPITDDEWTTMAYVGDTARLCQAIVDGDLEHVEDWCSQEGVDVNRRDYTGRTPLHLAVMASTPEIVQCLIDHGARLIARLVDGRTALHLAAARGSNEMVKALMDKSLANEAEEEEKGDARRTARKAEKAKTANKADGEMSDAESEASEITLDSEESDSMTMGSFVKVDKEKDSHEVREIPCPMTAFIDMRRTGCLKTPPRSLISMRSM